MKNILGREVPDFVLGYGKVTPFKGAFKNFPEEGKRKAAPLIKYAIPRYGNKVVNNLEEVFLKIGIKDGMTLSFHHHFRNGDKILTQVIDVAAKLGLKNLTVAASGIMLSHHGLVPHLKSGVVTHIDTNGLMGAVAEYIAKGKMENPIVIRSHGGRARAIEAGDLHIDVAFMGASCADIYGNMNGCEGNSIFGSIGYGIVDSQYADYVVAVTDMVQEIPLSFISIPQTRVDYVVKLDTIGDSKGIATGTLSLTKDPIQLDIARNALKIVDALGFIKDGFSFQTGGGGPSIAFTKFLKDLVKEKNIKAGFAMGGITAAIVEMLEEGLLSHAYDTQSFDLYSAQSIRKNQNHIEVGCDFYASPFNNGCAVNGLDVCLIGAFEVDLDFNINCLTGMDGIARTGIGGNPDTAAGSKVSIVTANLIRSRVPTIVEKVHTLCTPGESVDVIVTDRGIAVNPLRQDLISTLTQKGIKLNTVEELKEIAENIVGVPEEIKTTDKVVAVIEYRDGTILDTIRQVKEN
ncbi:citrate lyase subunit alpha [Candidatus Epulonipiscium fishelsonii]|nr:citrate lyase subunit alpha [Epulopiscium sp. SCG-C06WGA-EpuloA1]